jgi:hypothetical protein
VYVKDSFDRLGRTRHNKIPQAHRVTFGRRWERSEKSLRNPDKDVLAIHQNAGVVGTKYLAVTFWHSGSRRVVGLRSQQAAISFPLVYLQLAIAS